MNLSKALLWALPLSLLSNLGAAALARKAELELLPSLRGPQANCPERLIAYETPRPYTEGGSATDGMIQLKEIATDIAISQSNEFSVTWSGKLKPEYADCVGTAGITVVDGEAFQGHSYIRVQLMGGEARAILDMTGMRDVNGYTRVIVDQTMREGNPRWAWGGSD